MTGLDYFTRLNQLISEATGSYWIDKKTSFDFIYEAAKDFAKEVKAFHSSQTVSTVVSLTVPYFYSLSTDFMEILTQDEYGNKTLKFTDAGGNVSWLERVAYGYILYDNNTTAVPNPTRFAITDNPQATRVTGTATGNSTNAGGESTLTDATAAFTSDLIGADIINTTSGKGYIGVVLSVTSATALVTAMFDISTNQSVYANWATNDTYIIQPQTQYALIIDPPPATASMTVAVPYISKPRPVYSDYGSYSFATGYEEALLKYAAWLYKYRDSKAQFGDELYRFYDMAIRKAKNVNRGATTPKSFKISFIQR